MLKYERQLNFDKRYEQLKEVGTKPIVTICKAAVLYTGIYFLFKCMLSIFPSYDAWDNGRMWFIFYNITFIKIDILYFMVGLLTYCWGTIRLRKITMLNHSVRINERIQPSRILSHSFYAETRHPMYGSFIMIYAGILLSSRSLYGLLGILLFVILQYWNAAREERQLIQFFGEEYRSYQTRVRCRCVTSRQVAVLIIFFALTMLGFMFG